MKPRNEPAYLAARAWLTAHPNTPCWRRCGRTATTIDHVPPLRFHHHRGRGCCELRPACTKCNYGDGARIAQRVKAQRRGRRAALTSRSW
jgi:hypothetical protein